METAANLLVPSPSITLIYSRNFHKRSSIRGFNPIWEKISNSAVSRSCSAKASLSGVGDVRKRSSSLESLFRYDKAVPEEIIEKPIGLSLAEKDIGNNPQCPDCSAKGAVLCATCSGSGLYVDSVLESQGIIVKVRCLGCGGSGNILCSECGGRGHLGTLAE